MVRYQAEPESSTGTTLRGLPGRTADRRQVSVTAFGEGVYVSERATRFELVTSSLGIWPPISKTLACRWLRQASFARSGRDRKGFPASSLPTVLARSNCRITP